MDTVVDEAGTPRMLPSPQVSQPERSPGSSMTLTPASSKDLSTNHEVTPKDLNVDSGHNVNSMIDSIEPIIAGGEGVSGAPTSKYTSFQGIIHRTI